jgi:propanediol dehydratase small subunit
VRFERPVTLREVRIPVLVMFGCAAVAKDPVMAEPAMRFEPSMAPLTIPTKRVAVTALVTPSDVRVPTDVMLGCAAVARDPVIAEPAMRFEPSTAPL